METIPTAGTERLLTALAILWPGLVLAATLHLAWWVREEARARRQVPGHLRFAQLYCRLTPGDRLHLVAFARQVQTDGAALETLGTSGAYGSKRNQFHPALGNRTPSPRITPPPEGVASTARRVLDEVTRPEMLPPRFSRTTVDPLPPGDAVLQRWEARRQAAIERRRQAAERSA